jgi:glucuronokinase
MVRFQETEGIAHARVGLLGNPSDGWGGKAIAFSLRNFRARVLIAPSDRLVLEAGSSDLQAFPSLREACRDFESVGCEDGLRLLRAAIHRFVRHREDLARLPRDDPRLRFEMRYETDIPRQVGLAGSSAIVIAVLRALMARFDVEIAPEVLAELALAAEVEDLGIAAGPMDRVVQTYGGLVLMDLREPRSADSYRRLDPKLLPPLFVAWDPRGGQSSGVAHGPLRARWQRGDPELLRVVEEFRELVDEGEACLLARDEASFRELMERNFELRARIFPIGARDREMVSIARAHGAVAKLCGAGGAVVGAPEQEVQMAEIARAYGRAGFETLRPRLGSRAGAADRGASA